MTFDELLAAVSQRLTELGFIRSAEDIAGPMGSARIRFSSDLTDVELHNDRGLLSMSAGRTGAPTYGCRVWADLLGADLDDDPDVSLQTKFLLGHLGEIEQWIRLDPHIDERLRDLNWSLVKEHLGLDPDMPGPGDR